MNPPTVRASKKYNNKEWTTMFEKLQAYKREHNTCNVPKRYQSDPKLGHWVHYQRTMCKGNKLSQERKDLLDSLGFVWSERQSSNVSREQASWDERFQELKVFHSIHGHCKVPRKGKDAALGRWVKWQRWNRTLLERGESSVLTKRKIKLLNSIGFSWGYQRLPPQTNTRTVSPSDESIEPLPYMPEETLALASIELNSRSHAVPPSSFAPSLRTNSRRDDRASFSPRYGGSTFSNQEANARQLFNQVNFIRPGAISPLDDDSVRFDRRDVVSSNAFDFPTQFQGYVTEPVSIRTFQGINRSNVFPQMMEDQYKMLSDQMDTGRHVAASKVWKCSVCRYASFDTYDEALTHENSCNGFPEGSFCRACAA